MSLRQRLAEKMKEWEVSIESGTLDAAKAFQAEVEDLSTRIKLQEQLEAAKGLIPDPVRPVLPGVTGDATSADNGIIKGITQAITDDEKVTNSQKAAYVTRFGTVEDTIKGILRDLHGGEYQTKYWSQKAAFKKYLRHGDKEMAQSDLTTLREVVMNPSMIKAALDEGWDDLSSLKATMVEASGTLGGYVAPVDFQMKVIERMAGMTVMRGRATTNTTSRDRVEVPEITGGNNQYTTGVRGKWVDETPTAGASETNFTFGMRGIPIYTYMAETPLSRNNVEDSAFDIEGYLSKKFAEATKLDEDNAFLTGDGVGKPQGILPGGANSLNLTRKPSGDANLLTWNGLISMTYAIDAQYRQSGSVWIANKSTYEAISKLTSGGIYLWSAYQYEGGEGGRPPRLLGYETLEQETLPSIAAGTFPLIFGNPGGYHIYDRVGMTVERYLDASTARQNLVYYVLRRRLGGQPIEKWQFAVLEIAVS